MEKINILCFGDSLTAGYSSWGTVFTPYGDTLPSSLFPSWQKTRVSITIDGRSGDLVGQGGSFKSRLEKKNPYHNASIVAETKTPYDFIIILGGTNDLGYGRQASTIIESLNELYEISHAHGANTLALTIPECHAKSEKLDKQRNHVNRDILDVARDRFYTLDIHTLIPYHSLSSTDRESIWDDGLHLKPYGYDLISQYVANRLVEIVSDIGVEKALNVNAKSLPIAKEGKEGKARSGSIAKLKDLVSGKLKSVGADGKGEERK